MANLLDKKYTLIAGFMGPTWGPSGADRTHVGPHVDPVNVAIWVKMVLQGMGLSIVKISLVRSSYRYHGNLYNGKTTCLYLEDLPVFGILIRHSIIRNNAFYPSQLSRSKCRAELLIFRCIGDLNHKSTYM